MTARSPGFYWVTPRRFDGSALPAEIAEWCDDTWAACGVWERQNIADADVLEGPLQPPKPRVER